MKKISFFFASIILVLTSCSENLEDTNNQVTNVQETFIKYYSCLLPAEYVKNQLIIDVRSEDDKYSNQTDGICHIAQGSKYYIRFRIDENSTIWVTADSRENHDCLNFMDLTLAKAKEYIKQKGYPRQDYCYAGVKRGARIYADKTIAGREPGADISDLMSVDLLYKCKVQLTYPDFQIYKDYYADNNTVLFSDYFKEGTVLPRLDLYFISFVESPAEQYDEITYTIEIPFECEYMRKIICGQDYKEEYYEQGLVERNENRMLKGSVTVRFD